MVSEWLATKGLDTGSEALTNYELDKVLQCSLCRGARQKWENIHEEQHDRNSLCHKPSPSGSPME